MGTILKCTSIKKHLSEPSTCPLSSLSLVAPPDRPLSSSAVPFVSVGQLQVVSDTSSPVLVQVTESNCRLPHGSVAWESESNAPVALYIASSPHPPTLPACLLCCPQPPTCAVFIRKGWKSEYNGPCVSLPSSQEECLLHCFKRTVPFFLVLSSLTPAICSPLQTIPQF